MTTEKEIVYERDGFWVFVEPGRKAFTVYRPSPSFTHSIADSTYEDLSVAKARVDYLARRGEP